MTQIDPVDIAAWTHGKLIHGAWQSCRGVFTDTRQPQSGGLFVALRGERFDGHTFVRQAAEQGAYGALVAESCAEQVLAQVADLDRPFFVCAVSDTLVALQQLARGWRSRFSGPVVAITGSNGKTTTKELTAACLGTQTAVLATHGNYNNEIGLPLTLLRLSEEHGACVVEMAMRAKGQIAALAAIAAPDVGVVTNVGPVHLETLGTVEDVAEAKGELVAALNPDGVAVLNADDALVAAMARRTSARVLTYGLENPAARVQARNISRQPLSTSFDLWIDDGYVTSVTVGLPGLHNVANALAALAATKACGFDPLAAAPALAEAHNAPMRLEITELPGGILLVNDAYNASPLSMRAALDVLSKLGGKRKVAVLGDMLELGAERERQHRLVGERAVASGVDLLVTVGSGGRLIMEGACSCGFPPSACRWYADAAAAAAEIEAWLERNDCILIKASRGMRLEQVAAAVTAAAQKVQ